MDIRTSATDPLPLTDAHNRQINYLRVAVTDRCNLRCTYCMPAEGIPLLRHADILSFEEILRVAAVSVGLGIRKIRITGGEPLARRGLPALVAALAALPGLADLSLTTNGTLLAAAAPALRGAGLRRVNVSLDTLKPDRFRAITLRGDLADVLAGIRAAETAGLMPVKINAVIVRDVNADEVVDFARLTLDRPLEVRFIEFMPLGCGGGWSHDRLVPGEEVLAAIARTFPLEPDPSMEAAAGPSRMFRIRSAAGRIGLINPMTEHFCHLCNRLRLTPDGRLRTCLFSESSEDLRSLLRSGAGDPALAECIRAAVSRKPPRHAFGQGMPTACATPMSRIGG
jgi:cyclic pyranopterin phosphate synthase